jgi:REP element-mobilizing transposase RayT
MNDKSKYNPNIHHRKSIRLKGYDYSQAGLYFITICCQDRACLFGHIENSEMVLNDAGKMVETEWLKLHERFNNIELHEFVVMPNHFHAILEIVGATLVVAQNDVETQNGHTAQNDIDASVGATLVVAQNDVETQNGHTAQNDIETQNGQPQGIAPTSKTIGNMVGAFQSIVTVEYIRGVKTLGWQPFNGKLWQRNYYEHIIRNEQSHQTISKYIINNPSKWNDDKFYKL